MVVAMNKHHTYLLLRISYSESAKKMWGEGDLSGVTLACEGLGRCPVGHQETMGHRHQWQSEPPQGKLSLGKSWDKIYGDEEDMAANAMYNSHEEIQQLRNLLLKDLDF